MASQRPELSAGSASDGQGENVRSIVFAPLPTRLAVGLPLAALVACDIALGWFYLPVFSIVMGAVAALVLLFNVGMTATADGIRLSALGLPLVRVPREAISTVTPVAVIGSPWATRWLFGVMWHPMGILFAAGTPLIKVERLTRMPVIVSCSSDDAAERITRVLGLEANADTA